jgi:hypothetical protein
MAALRCFADGAAIAMRKRAWPQHKIIPVKWLNLGGKCFRGRSPAGELTLFLQLVSKMNRARQVNFLRRECSNTTLAKSANRISIIG